MMEGIEKQEFKTILDDEVPDDVNVIIKVVDDTVEFHLNPNRVYSTMKNKNVIVAGLNKKLSQLIEEFKSKISLKKQEDGKSWVVLIKDVVYDRIKEKSQVYVREGEQLLSGIVNMMLHKKEMQEDKSLKEIRDLEKAQDRIDNDKKMKKK